MCCWTYLAPRFPVPWKMCSNNNTNKSVSNDSNVSPSFLCTILLLLHCKMSSRQCQNGCDVNSWTARSLSARLSNSLRMGTEWLTGALMPTPRCRLSLVSGICCAGEHFQAVAEPSQPEALLARGAAEGPSAEVLRAKPQLPPHLRGSFSPMCAPLAAKPRSLRAANAQTSNKRPPPVAAGETELKEQVVTCSELLHFDDASV